MAEQKQFFRIQGNSVQLVTERVERTVRLQDLMGEVAKEAGITTSILPSGCRFFNQKGERSVFVIEQAPQTRQIVWTGMEGNDKWKLAFPYIIFVTVFNGEAVATGDCKIFYRSAPLSGLEDIVSSTNLGNTELNGYICTGSIRVDGKTLAQKAESFVSGYWKSVFNMDIQNSWNAHCGISSVSSLSSWQEASAKNPFFPLSVKWKAFGCLGDVIEGRC